MFHVGVGMYRERLGTSDLPDTVTFLRSRRLACLQQLFGGNEFLASFCQADTVTSVLPDHQRFPAPIDTIVVAERDGT